MLTNNKTVILCQKNVEELVFYNTELQKKLPEFSDIFQTWRLGKLIPALRPTAQKAVLDFLERLTVANITILENHLGCKIIIEKLDHHIIKNYTLTVSTIETALNSEMEKYNRFFAFRKNEQLYISFWR